MKELSQLEKLKSFEFVISVNELDSKEMRVLELFESAGLYQIFFLKMEKG